jgi:hypothetical protein
LYQGTTSVVPDRRKKEWGFSPCNGKICTKFEWKSAGAKAPFFVCAAFTARRRRQSIQSRPACEFLRITNPESIEFLRMTCPLFASS